MSEAQGASSTPGKGVGLGISTNGGRTMPALGRFSSSGGTRPRMVPPGSISPGVQQSEQMRNGSEDETDDLEMEGIDASGRRDIEESYNVVDSDGNIVLDPQILAERFLPALFRQYGALAARHIAASLAKADPHFGTIPPVRGRRLVVKALELKQGVLFEKVGWGRWNLLEGNVRGQPLNAVFTPETAPSRGSMAMSAGKRPSMTPSILGTSYSADFMFSPALSMSGQPPEDEDIDVDPLDLEEGDESETDEEDWKALGPEGLRSRSQLSSSVAIVSPSFSGSPARFAQSFHAGCPYPMRRKSSAGVFQMKPSLGSLSGNSSRTPSFTNMSFAKKAQARTTSLSSSNKGGLSHMRETGGPASRVRREPAAGPPRSPAVQTSDADREAVEALCMLSGSLDQKQHQ
ncbi:DNA-binding proteins Bright/BRCAA1/RBP1 and proteins containing BRIGHT domain [Savitreella phatthalungensis]